MDLANQLKLLNKMTKERHALLVLSAGLLAANLMLAYVVLMQDTKTILVPTHFDKTVEISDSYISNSYLETMARDFVGQVLNLTSESYEYVESYVLGMAHPSVYGDLKQQLVDLSDDITKRDISLHFNITEVEANNKTMRVIVRGFLDTRVGYSVVSHEQKQYEILFNYRFGSLLVKGFKEVQNEEE